MSLRAGLLSLALLATSAVAQTWTSCQPLNQTCPPNPALGTTFQQNFTANDVELDTRFWNITNGNSLISFADSGLNLVCAKKTDAVTIQSNFFIMWGQMEIIMKAAPGVGIISTAILISDDLDEIDWEIMGGNSTYVENNYYGWGNQDQRFAEYDPLNGASEGYHNYTIDWNQDRINFMIDGNIARVVKSGAPGLYPQTPMQMRFGIWPGGASDAPGTVEWAGGKTDFSQGPFSMQIKSIRVTDGTQNTTSYSYSDHSGAWQSIVGTAGQSQAYIDMHTLTSAQRMAQNWANLSTGAKVGIGCAIGGVFLVGFIVFAVYVCSQRRAGRAERELADKEWEQHTNELADYRRMMAKGQFAVQHMGHGEKF